MKYEENLTILKLMELCGDKGIAITLHRDPTRLFNKYALSGPDGLIADTDDPAEALWEWMKRN